MIRSAMRRLGLTTSRISGMQRMFRLRSRGPTVLFYHGVEENYSDPEVQVLHMPLRLFERQIAFLRHHREVISLDDLYWSLKRNSFDPNQVVLTFDDGYRNNLRIVAPLLKAWNLPFTIFISTRHIARGLRFPMYYIRAAMLYTEKNQVHLNSIQSSFDLSTREKRRTAIRRITEVVKTAPLDLVQKITKECEEQVSAESWCDLNARFSSDEPMSWKDVNQTVAMGAIVGSHCHDHCILHSNQSLEEINLQLNTSKAEIAEHTAECKYLAYPNGTMRDISEVAHSSVKTAEFRMAFSTILGEITSDVDCFLAPRMFAVPDYEEFCYLLNRSGDHNETYKIACLGSTAASYFTGVGRTL